MKILALSFSLIVIANAFSDANAQTLPVGTPALEDLWREQQIKGQRNLSTSFTIRPINISDSSSFESVFSPTDTSLTRNSTLTFARGKGLLRILPATVKLQYNTHHPYGWNDGSMIPARGYQHQVSAGVFVKLGHLNLQLRPETVFAQNKDFNTAGSNWNDQTWKSYYYFLNRIDNPEKYGAHTYSKLLPGQSSLRLNVKKLSLGISTENLWWGPGIRNSLAMSNNAPGFKHISFNTTAPINSPIGSFEWQLVSGMLKSSNILPDTNRTLNNQKLYVPKKNDDRYLNGLVLTWQPKWTKGLHLGITRLFYQYKSELTSGPGDYLPVIGQLFKKNLPNEDAAKRDQLASVFFRLILPKEKAEVYGEYGRNDHSLDLRDFFLEPEHASAYIVGLKKIFDVNKQNNLELFMEFAHLQNSQTMLLRELEGWYTHYQVRHGYTNLGQVIGAGIGTGSNSQSFGFNWLKETKQLGVLLERVVRNNDFYYNAFTASRNYQSHWVDISLNISKPWYYKRFIYTANLSLIKTYNYHWEEENDVNNIQFNVSASYLF